MATVASGRVPESIEETFNGLSEGFNCPNTAVKRDVTRPEARMIEIPRNRMTLSRTRHKRDTRGCARTTDRRTNLVYQMMGNELDLRKSLELSCGRLLFINVIVL